MEINLFDLKFGLKKSFKTIIYTSSGWQAGWTILIGRLVTEGHEPRQVRKEAAISDFFCVVDRSRSCNFSLTLLPVGFFFFYPSILYLDMFLNRLIFLPSFN
jgi:hypothetical protein